MKADGTIPAPISPRRARAFLLACIIFLREEDSAELKAILGSNAHG